MSQEKNTAGPLTPAIGVLDIDRKEVVRTGYRILKERGKSGARLRVPAGELPVDVLPAIKNISEKYGNGFIHLTTRQGIEILHINLKDIAKVKEELSSVVKRLEATAEVFEGGYQATGTRNFVICVGNRVCPFANCDSTALGLRIEREFHAKPFHMKIGVAACPNDCARAGVMDIGVIGVVDLIHDAYRCVGCGRCSDRCKRFAGAIEVVNSKAIRDDDKCIKCGECAVVCPMRAWKRGKETFRVFAGGRLGKKNPRLAMPLAQFVDEDSVIKIIANIYAFINKYIDRDLDKEFVGYIIDRIGFDRFKKEALAGISQ